MNAKTKKGAALAAAAAGLFALGSAQAADKKAKGMKGEEACKDLVQCWGVNVCKGHGDCATVSNSCHDQADCKGKGWVKISRSACEDIGGEAKALDFDPKAAK